MAAKKLTKQEMRDDQFRDVLSELYFGALNTISENWRAFAVGFAAVLLLLAGAFYLWQAHLAKEARASYLLGQVMDAYNAPVEATPAQGRSSQLSFPSEAQRAQAVDTRLAAYQQAVGASSPLALYYKALSQAQGGNASGAAATLDPVTKDAKLGSVALSLQARLYESQGQWDKAEADWKALTAISTPTWTKAEGFLALGAYYERRSMKDKAMQAYEQAETLAGQQSDETLAKKAKEKVDSLKGRA